MGNQLAAAQTSGYQDQQVLQQRLGTFQLIDQLGGGRFLKSFACLHDEGQLVMKIYTKREPVSLARVARDLEAMRDKFNKNWPECCNVAAFTRIVETDRGAYLLRQHVHHNLYERLSQRPFLHMIERRWIAYQLLQALAQSHACGVCHGDIKTENVVLTAWDWVLLADYAPFKPRSLPDDNPADFSFFFDTPGKQGRPGRRLCYVAPERFTSAGEAPSAEALAALASIQTAIPAPAVSSAAAPGSSAAPSAASPAVKKSASESGFTVPGAPGEELAALPAPVPASSRRGADVNVAIGEEWEPSGGELGAIFFTVFHSFPIILLLFPSLLSLFPSLFPSFCHFFPHDFLFAAPAHDVFSLGCVIAEIFSSTKMPTFSYAEMLRYRKERAAFPLEAKLAV